MVVTTRRERQIPAIHVPEVQDESYGATQIGPFDYVPKLGSVSTGTPASGPRKWVASPRTSRCSGMSSSCSGARTARLLPSTNGAPTAAPDSPEASASSKVPSPVPTTVTLSTRRVTASPASSRAPSPPWSTRCAPVSILQPSGMVSSWSGWARPTPFPSKRTSHTSSPTRPSQDVNTPGSRRGKPTGPSP